MLILQIFQHFNIYFSFESFFFTKLKDNSFVYYDFYDLHVVETVKIFSKIFLQEIKILEMECIEGSTEIWVCLCSLEVLRVCKGSSLHTAALCSFLREKLLHLGRLCGLMPGRTPTSPQLHLVVYIILQELHIIFNIYITHR